jgi:hypothetical protein
MFSVLSCKTRVLVQLQPEQQVGEMERLNSFTHQRRTFFRGKERAHGHSIQTDTLPLDTFAGWVNHTRQNDMGC